MNKVKALVIRIKEWALATWEVILFKWPVWKKWIKRHRDLIFIIGAVIGMSFMVIYLRQIEVSIGKTVAVVLLMAVWLYFGFFRIED